MKGAEWERELKLRTIANCQVNLDLSRHDLMQFIEFNVLLVLGLNVLFKIHFFLF